MEMHKRKSDTCLPEHKRAKTDSTVEQDFINYITIPSLESIAISSILIRIWKQPDLKEAIQRHSYSYESKGYICERQRTALNKLEEKILEKLATLPLPNRLKTKLNCNVMPIGFQILKWLDRREEYYSDFHNSHEPLDTTFWTMIGTINKVEILKYQISRKNVTGYTVREFFIIACNYCLEDYVRALWIQIPEREDFCTKIINRHYRHHLVLYWISVIKHELPQLLEFLKPNDFRDLYNCGLSINKNMFTLTVFLGNTVAMKYFWYKLTDEEIKGNLTKWVDIVMAKEAESGNYHQFLKRIEHTDVLCFLLSKMSDKDQQREVFQKHSKLLLISLFTDWPWHKFLVPTIQVMWDYLSEDVYVRLLSRIVWEIKRNRNAEMILKELWSLSPEHFKKCYIQYMLTSSGTKILWAFLEIEDIDGLKLILNSANDLEKKDFIFGSIRRDKDNYIQLIYEDKLHLIDIMIGNLLTAHEAYHFKNTLIFEIGHMLCIKWIPNDNWPALENFLKWGYSSQSEIDQFKSNIVNKFETANSIVCTGDYNRMNKFMQWYFNSEEEINQFKKKMITEVENKHYGLILDLGYRKWDLFLKFIDWCFESEVDIKQFKLKASEFNNLSYIVSNVILYGYNFKFAKELVNWLFDSEEEVKQFKRYFFQTSKAMDIFVRFVSDYKVYDSKHYHWELVRKLTQWFYPLDKKVITEFKKATSEMYYDIFGSVDDETSGAKEQALFQLLDTFSLDSRDSNNESDESDDDYISTLLGRISDASEDDSKSTCSKSDSTDFDVWGILSHLSISSSDDNESSCDENLNDSYSYDEDVVILLNGMLNQVSNCLSMEDSL